MLLVKEKAYESKPPMDKKWKHHISPVKSNSCRGESHMRLRTHVNVNHARALLRVCDIHDIR